MANSYKEALQEARDALDDIKERGDEAVSEEEWDDIEKEFFTPEEIAASDIRVAIIGELIKARKEKGISQAKLEELSGVRQPVIAKFENGHTNPQIDTVSKILAAVGMKLAVVPM